MTIKPNQCPGNKGACISSCASPLIESRNWLLEKLGKINNKQWLTSSNCAKKNSTTFIICHWPFYWFISNNLCFVRHMHSCHDNVSWPCYESPDVEIIYYFSILLNIINLWRTANVHFFPILIFCLHYLMTQVNTWLKHPTWRQTFVSKRSIYIGLNLTCSLGIVF